MKRALTKLTPVPAVALVILAMAACSPKEAILKGERVSVLPAVTVQQADAEAAAQGAELPPVVAVPNARSVGLNPGHAGGHPQLEPALAKAWSVSIGGSGSDLVELPTPVVADGKVVTVTPDGTVSAFDVTNGASLWSTSIESFVDDPLPGIGGGIAISNDIVMVHAGGHVLAALSLDDGALQWSVTNALPLRGGPTVIDDRAVAVTDLDGNIQSWRITSGESLWDYAGLGAATVLFGAPAPAYANGELVVAGSGGEISIFDAFNGELYWTDSVASYNPRTPIEGIGDIRAHPIHDGGLIFAISQSGQLAAFSVRTGLPVWTQAIGGIEMPWLAGKTLFVVALDGRLYALRRSDGMVRWVAEMPGALPAGVVVSEKPTRYVGPIVAGNRVIVIGTGGSMLSYNADTGVLIDEVNVGGRIVTAPQIAGGRLFVLANDGTLTAFK